MIKRVSEFMRIEKNHNITRFKYTFFIFFLVFNLLFFSALYKALKANLSSYASPASTETSSNKSEKTPPKASDPSTVKIGDDLDKHEGVSVYANGAVYSQSHGKHFAKDGYYFGQKWQCVEFVKRFYYEKLDHRMPDVYGHAIDFFDPKISHGKMNPRRGLMQYKNGASEKPKSHDLLVFDGVDGYGHVAIITEVGDDFIEVIQQNMPKPRARFRLKETDGIWSIGESWKPLGWLRKD